MKKSKLVSGLIVLAMTLSLFGCSSEQTQVDTQKPLPQIPEETYKSDTIPTTSEPEEQPTEEQTVVLPSFSVSVTEITKNISDSISNTEMPNAFENAPTKTGTDNEGYSFAYDIVDGVEIILYGDQKDNLTQVFIHGNLAKMDADSEKILGGYQALLTQGFSSDNADLEKIDSDLKIVEYGFTDGTMTFSNGRLASFAYLVDGDNAMLSITPIA